jgi:hypothetical protein
VVPAILAALVVSMLGSTAAEADSPQFRCVSFSTECRVAGSTNDIVLNVAGGNNKCIESKGTPGVQLFTNAPRDTPSLSLYQIYGGKCYGFGGIATVSPEGCSWQLSLTSEAQATVGLVCPPGKAMIWDVPSLPCTTTFPAQSGLTGTTVTNVSSSPKTVSVTWSVKGLTYTKKGAGCPEGSGTKSDGKMTGTTTLKAWELTDWIVGPQVNFEVS